MSKMIYTDENGKDWDIEEITKAGWRCCIDHLLKPEHPCPICELEKVQAENKQLKSLLNRIHKATEQFYCKKPDKTPDTCPYTDIVNLYHLCLPGLPRIQKMTEKRKAAMRKRWREDLTTLEDWTAYFQDASRKPFLHGRNDREWVADIDFFLREQSITYMQEGKYG